MPSLKDLTCSIELSDYQQALQEFGTIYKDGIVETFVAVPSRPQTFSVHLTSNKFIAPGLSMYVFIDGVYQCNRNRQDLKLRKPVDSRSLVDFKVRQKEEKQKDGSMVAREWTFAKLRTASADDAPDRCSPNILDNIGCIEIVVLRCAGPRTAHTASPMNLDGAGDVPDHHFGLDGQPRTPDGRSAYDDRTLPIEAFNNSYRPPPPVPFYRSPYVESIRSYEDRASRSHRHDQTTRATSPLASVYRHLRPHSQYSEPINLGTRPPYLGYQYGSGPLPPENEPFHARPLSSAPKAASGMDAEWLDSLLTKAVKKGVEESRRNAGPPQPLASLDRHTQHREVTRQPPGAWPVSPYGHVAQFPTHPESSGQPMYNPDATPGVAWGQPTTNWSHDQVGNRKETDATWNEEPVWEKESNAGGWHSLEETPDDSWDTDETWTTKKPKDRGRRSGRSRSRGPTARSSFSSRSESPVTIRIHERRRSNTERSRRTRSKPRSRRSKYRDSSTSSSGNNDGWTRIEITSGSVASFGSSEDTVQPSHSRSHVYVPRSKDRRSRHSKSGHGHDERKSSQHTSRVPEWQPTEMSFRAPPSVATRLTPTVMNAPVSLLPASGRSKRGSVYNEPAISVAQPPTWRGAVPEKLRKNSYATSYKAPAPYAATLHDFAPTAVGEAHQGGRSTSLSSWGSGKKSGSMKELWGDSAEQKTGWDDVGDSAWEKKSTSKEDESGWQAMDDNQNSGWNTAADVEVVQASGWDTNNSGRGEENTFLEEKTEGKAEADTAWNTNQDNGNTTKDAGAPWINIGDTWNNQGNAEDTWNNQGNVQDSWNNQDNTNKNPDVPPWNTDPPPDKPAKPLSTSKRHTTKSLSKYRQLRSPPASDLAPKPHWQFPPPPPSRPNRFPITQDDGDDRGSKAAYIAPKEPLYKISKEVASEKGIEHQVRAGKGMQYGHVVGRPEYLDRLDRPYAVFRFKYRSRSVLKAMFGDLVPDRGHLTTAIHKEGDKQHGKEHMHQHTHKHHEPKHHESKHYESKHHEPKHHEHSKESKERRQSDAATEVVARDLTENWVKQQSRETSEKGGKDENPKKKSKKQESSKKGSVQKAEKGGNEFDAAWGEAGAVGGEGEGEWPDAN
ncbi:hypothetical protein N0V83_004079 [Neocucurbitaria cava]|uniref:Uncharacterized protein n=1 Tax=Neocucurbitaria cava TaxID=798079 RepID=A0A9W8YAP0_9PLEO|nr:hypothetical protein N0V83_004079 [Neocucurbitaria cava]